MIRDLEPWQLKQLVRFSQHHPERIQMALNLIWEAQPDLFVDLAIAAVDQEQLSVADCEATLGLTNEEVMARLLAFRQSGSLSTSDSEPAKFAVVIQGEAALARLPGSGVAVWEIVRQYRKTLSWDRLIEAFPSVNPSELSLALEYGTLHSEEIDRAIEHYEQMLEKRRSLYPFAR